MPRQSNNGIPTPPPVAGPSGGGVPGLPKPMSPMGGGPGQGLGGVPEPDDLAGMLRGFSSGTVPPEQVVQAMTAQSLSKKVSKRCSSRALICIMYPLSLG